MKIFVTGGGGYIGTTLVPYLLQKGHFVTVLDRFFFGRDLMSDFSAKNLHLITDDIRWFDGKLLKGHDAVVDLAALSNDPSGELDPWKTIEINYLGRSRVARLAREAGVARYFLASSCSIYGFQDGVMTEESKPNPLTTYARANVLAEQDNLGLSSKEFTPLAARFATVYGLSKRMRFDLAINGMVRGASRTGKIPVMRDGSQWRPFIAVKDVAKGILHLLEADQDAVSGQVFNLGSDNQNYKIGELAKLVANSLSSKPEIEWYGDPDKRSYQVSFRKVKTLGFEVGTTPEKEAKEIEGALDTTKSDEDPRTITLNWYKRLLNDPESSKRVLLRGAVL